MKNQNYYKVGGHIFSLSGAPELFDGLNLQPYEPFRVESPCSALFEIELLDQIAEPTLEPIIIDAPLSSPDMPQVNIYRTQSGHLYNLIMPHSKEVNASLAVDYTQHTARLALNGPTPARQMAVSNALILSYISFTMEHSTLLLHASTVILEGKAYLFLGKSGTGKSTHSRMWLSALEGAELLNDDHPIVRTHQDGAITVYGSPWSGKTPCYRNLSAPLGAIVRISRAKENLLEPLKPFKAYASITTSCSGSQWSKRLMNYKVKAIEKIVERSRGYIMHCLPNTEAAEVCYQGIKENTK